MDYFESEARENLERGKSNEPFQVCSVDKQPAAGQPASGGLR
jgi:hypothetical protein